VEKNIYLHVQDLNKILHGVIWDMDGVLIDSMKIHFNVWQKVFLQVGVDFNRKNFSRNFGTTNIETITAVLGTRLSREESMVLVDKKQALFEQQAIKEAQLIPGVQQWLQFFNDRGIPQAVASSNAQHFIESVSAHLGIDTFFQAIISAENLASKPDPAVFLESARQIRAFPPRCLVFEDAVAGIEGARRAGMKCIAVATTNSKNVLNTADLIINGFSDLSPEQLINVMGL